MYVPSIHKPNDPHDAYDYIRSNGFATLVSEYNGKQIATHIPMYLDRDEDGGHFLLSHIAVANEQKACFDGRKELLAIFMEQHAYVSSSWYDHVNVPTWNYVAVHAYGTANIITGKELYTAIQKLVNQYEDGRSERFQMSDMSEEMIQAHFKGLVGFSMKIERIESSYKLSQNRKDHDYHNVISQLENTGDAGSKAIANQMKKLRS